MATQPPQNENNEKNTIFCAICERDLEPEFNKVEFPCKHVICSPCSPYLLLRAMNDRLITSSSFLNNTLETMCPICREKFQIKLTPLINNNNNIPPKPMTSSSIMCEYCEKMPRSHYCLDCEQSFCRYCLDYHHAPNKKWSSHEIHEGNALIAFMKFPCKCSQKQDMDNFCLECAVGFCRECKNKHQSHRFANLVDIYKEKEKINKEIPIQQCFAEYVEELHKIEKIIKAQKRDYQAFLDNTIASLLKMKENSEEEFNSLKTQLKWYQNSFCYLIDEIDKSQTQILYPNKVFHFLRFFALKSIKPENHDFQNIKLQLLDNPYYIKGFKENYQKIFTTIRPKIIIKEEYEDNFFDNFKSNIKQESEENDKKIEKINKIGEKNPSIDFLDNDNPNNREDEKEQINEMNDSFSNKQYSQYFSSEKFNNFLTNPSKFQEKYSSILQKNNFGYFLPKSKISASFALNNETFLVWGSPKNKDDLISLNINNISRRKFENIFYLNGNISVLSVYPNENAYDSKEFLYCGDSSGTLTLYYIRQKPFKEAYKIETKCNKEILAAVLFSDVFEEIQTNIFVKIYALIVLNDNKMNFKIYSLKGEIIREIKNPTSSFCFALNYFVDEKNKTIRFFFGFSKSCLMEYNLKTDSFSHFYQTNGNVQTLNFIFRKNKPWLIFTEEDSNKITVLHARAKVLIKEKLLKDFIKIYDLCIWNMKNYCVLGAQDEDSNNFLLILDNKTFEIVKKINLGLRIPVNLQKILIINEKNQKIRECMICFETSSENTDNWIVLFE